MVDDNNTDAYVDKTDLKKKINIAIKISLLMFLLQFVLAFIGQTFIFGLPISYSAYMLTTTIFEVIIVLVSALAAIYYGAKKLNINVRKLLDVKQFSWDWLGKGLAMHYSASFLGNIILLLFNFFLAFFSAEIPHVEVGSQDLIYFIINVIEVAIIAGVTEEIIFRGIICNALARYNKGFAVVVSALIFALMHLNLDQAVPAFLIGICFGYIYLRSGSLLVTILIHIINNFLALLLTSLGDSFIVSIMSILLFALVAYGITLWYKERNEVGAMIQLSTQATTEWSTLVRSGWFWFIAILFALSSLMMIFSSVTNILM